jgi:hypothetical protein
MPLDVDSMVAALTPPSVVIQGHTYTGRLLSFVQAEELRAQFAATTEPTQRIAFARAVCDAIGIPSEPVLGLPPAIVWEVIGSFFVALFAGPPPAPTNAPSGSDAS